MKRHKRKKKKLRKNILILCEGLSEKNYFQAIKEDKDYKQALSAIHPQIVAAKSPTPEQVVKEAIKRVKKAEKSGNKYDIVWLVFDHDHHTHRKEAYSKALKSKFSVAYSAIAFEQWYWLHFVKSAKAFPNGEQLKKALLAHYPKYEKAKQNDFAFLKEHLNKGLENAKWLRAQIKEEEKHLTDCNPWTDVDILVRYLLDLKEEEK
ncbi:MAG: RloB family protein [Bacteroidota bacterium]